MRTATAIVVFGALALGGACGPRPAMSPNAKGPPSEPPALESVSVRVERGADGAPTVLVAARVAHAKAVEAALYAGEEEIGRAPVGRENAAAFEIDEPGDYRVRVEVAGAPLAVRSVTARHNACAGAHRRLEAHVVEPARIEREKGGFGLEVPGWSPNDRDDAWVVEWFYEGEKLYEGRGRAARFEELADRVERAHNAQDLDDVCAYGFGEHYPGPKQGQELLELPGAWEVRIHREGRPSLAATFTVRAKGKPAAPAAGELAPASGREFAYLEFATTETPKEIATLLRRIPSACPKQCPTMSMKAVTAPGQYAHESIGRAQPYPGCAERATPLPHVAHWRPAGSDIPHPMAFSREELRTLVRSVEAPAQRWAINQALFYGETQVDRPDFEYDSNLGPEANFQRRKAWENRDFAGQLGEEAQQRALAQKRMPPLQASIRKYGKAPWNEAETPSAPEGTNLDE